MSTIGEGVEQRVDRVASIVDAARCGDLFERRQRVAGRAAADSQDVGEPASSTSSPASSTTQRTWSASSSAAAG